MSSEHEHSAEEFARRLASLTPAATLTRDRVLYEAGRNAGRKEARPWRYVASIMTVGMIGVLAFETWIGRNQPMALSSPQQPMEQQPQVQMAQAPTDPNPQPSARTPLVAETTDYLRLRDLIIHRGVEALPRTAVARANPKKDAPRTATEDNESDGAWWRLRVQQMGGASL